MPSCRVRIEGFVETHVHRLTSLEDVPLVVCEKCFCCDSSLTAKAIIRSDSGKGIRVGVCPSCGYIGYMDRPEEEWLHHFYNSLWDKGSEKSQGPIKSFKRSKITDLISDGVNARKGVRVFEIGVGYGQLLKQLAEEGFDQLYGVEHSPHRAERAREYVGADVVHIPFGSREVDDYFLEEGKMDVVYSKSVLEHAYDPVTFIQSAARLQEPGGLLVIAVPNAWHEMTINTLLFLPHLHAFTRKGLWALASRNGYRPVKVLEEGKGIILIARRAEPLSATLPEELTEEANRNICTEKWLPELKGDVCTPGDYLYWWTVNDSGRTGKIRWLRSSKLIKKLTQVLFCPVILKPFWRLAFNVPKRRGAALVSYSEPDIPELEISQPDLTLLVK